MEFIKFKEAVAKQFSQMKNHDLFRTQIEKDQLWETYLSSFPIGSNPIFRERTEHDCNCCKQFIRAIGNVVTIIDGKLVSIWDVKIPDEPNYQVVADALSSLIKSKPIENIFLHIEHTAGTDKSYEETLNGVNTWNHFFVNIPKQFVCKQDIGTKLGDARSTFDVFYRGLTELTTDAFENVIDLVNQNSLYRGAEFKTAVENFYVLKKNFDKIKAKEEKILYAWHHSVVSPIGVTRLRNTAIGTLLIDLSEGVNLDKAVNSFESKVSGNTYKRPNAVYTEKMKQDAAKKMEELGLTSALSRRRAVMSDISVNNVLFADRSIRPKMGDSPFDLIDDSTAEKKHKKLGKTEEVSIEKFIKDILPSATSLELYVENKHTKNLVSLIAPVDQTAGKLFKWDNNFSWDYNGGVADSFIKERVKSAGGNVDAEVCFRLAWFNYDDLDLHMKEPDGTEIYFGSYRKNSNNSLSSCGGQLDVDMNAGGGKTREAVENIYYGTTNKMKTGRYRLFVNNYNKRENIDFGFEIEMQIHGEITRYSYNKPIKSDENVIVVEFDYNAKTGEFKIVKSLDGDTISKDIWGIKTNDYHKVTMMMLSPNHWDGQGTGNKHYFFMLNECKNEDVARGFFNEFLRSDLNQHRKVFEALGSKMLTSSATDELSGLGFSSTQRAELLCRVNGSFTRVIKILF